MNLLFWNSYNRLAQGHAKIMFRDKVTILDAIEVILLMDMTMPLKNKLFETSGNSPVGCSNPSAQNNDETFQCESLLQSNFPDNILRNHQTSCDPPFNFHLFVYMFFLLFLLKVKWFSNALESFTRIFWPWMNWKVIIILNALALIAMTTKAILKKFISLTCLIVNT